MRAAVQRAHNDRGLLVHRRPEIHEEPCRLAKALDPIECVYALAEGAAWNVRLIPVRAAIRGPVDSLPGSDPACATCTEARGTNGSRSRDAGPYRAAVVRNRQLAVGRQRVSHGRGQEIEASNTDRRGRCDRPRQPAIDCPSTPAGSTPARRRVAPKSTTTTTPWASRRCGRRSFRKAPWTRPSR